MFKMLQLNATAPTATVISAVNELEWPDEDDDDKSGCVQNDGSDRALLNQPQSSSAASIVQMTSSTTGLSSRRPVALHLPPIDTSLQINDVLDAAANGGVLPSSSAITFQRSVKFVNIGFSNLTYTVKTGIWNRSKC